MVSAVAAILLVPLVGQRLTTAPSARIVRSVQLTFAGDVAGPTFGESEFSSAVATDGGRIYFTQTIGNRHTLAQASVGGGEAVTIPTPFTHTLLLHLSPDGSRLLVREFDHARVEGPLWVIPVVGGAAHRLGDIVAHDDSWSPDGTRLLFARREELPGPQRREGTATARCDSWPRVLAALVPGRNAHPIHARRCPG